MKKLIYIITFIASIATLQAKPKQKPDLFPDGTPIPEWFRQTDEVETKALGKQYRITDYGVLNDGRIHTAEFQKLIDLAASNGGGCIVVPEGIYKTGALFFKQGVNLLVKKGGVILGSENSADYPLLTTRMEGETCKYYAALINADKLDGFVITGGGTIDGNGFTYWQHFWDRRSWNPKCTNKDEQRPRLVYVSNSKNVQIDGVNLQNSAFWTTHIYQSENVKLLRLHIYSPAKPVKAPSTDAIDIDACKNVLVKDCYMSVNDDAIALKGGKGPYADKFRTDYSGQNIPATPESDGNGGNENIIIEDCEYGFCHGCLTCGSESVYDHNIILRRIKVDEANNLLWLKMRPDTPQQYEYITVEDITGNAKNFILMQPWTQFYDLKGRESIPASHADHITMRRCDFSCTTFFNVKENKDQYLLSNFTFEDLNIKAEKPDFHSEYVDNFTIKNVNVNK